MPGWNYRGYDETELNGVIDDLEGERVRYTEPPPEATIHDILKAIIADRDEWKAKAEAYEAALEAMPGEVPTNWLDSLLTGPKAVLTQGEFDCRQIEALLRGIQDRLRFKRDEAFAALSAEKEKTDEPRTKA